MRAQREPVPFDKAPVARPANQMEVPHVHGTSRLHVRGNKEMAEMFGASVQRFCGRATRQALRSVAMSDPAEGHPDNSSRVLRAKRRVSFAASDVIIAAADSVNKTCVPPAPSGNDRRPLVDKKGGVGTMGTPPMAVVREPLLKVPLPEARLDSMAPPTEGTGGAKFEVPLRECGAQKDARPQEDPMEQDEVPPSNACSEPRVPPAEETGEAFDMPLPEVGPSEDARTLQDLVERDAEQPFEAPLQPTAPVAVETVGIPEVLMTEARGSEDACTQDDPILERVKARLSEANLESMAPLAATVGADPEVPLTEAGASKSAFLPDDPMERVEVSLPEAGLGSVAPHAETHGAGVEVPVSQVGASEDARMQENPTGREGASIRAPIEDSAEVGGHRIPNTMRIPPGTNQQQRQQNPGPQTAATKTQPNLFDLLQRRQPLNALEKQAATERQRSGTRKLLSLRHARKTFMPMDDAEKLVLKIVEDLEKENKEVSERSILGKLFATKHCSDENVLKAVKTQFSGVGQQTKGSGGNLLEDAGRSDSGKASLSLQLHGKRSFFLSIRSLFVHIYLLPISLKFLLRMPRPLYWLI